MPSRFLNELPSDNIISNNNLNSIYFSELENKNHIVENNSKYLDYKENILKGDRVFHQKFGYGLVINIENDNAEVKFEKTSTKKVKIDYLIKDANK